MPSIFMAQAPDKLPEGFLKPIILQRAFQHGRLFSGLAFFYN
jgi:hypothetical protein